MMTASPRYRLLVTTALAGLAVPAFVHSAAAQDAAVAAPVEAAAACEPGAACLPGDEVINLDAITVSATRTDAAPIDSLASVSVVRLADPKGPPTGSVPAIFLGVPGVATPSKGDDAGAAINIRGLQNFGRVAVTVDGARQNYQQTGHGPDGVFFLDPALIEDVTVVRGPIANVYGSGAVGGVVSFRTKNPSDFLRSDETWAVQGRAAYGTNGDELVLGTTAAYRFSDQFAVLGSLSTNRQSDFDDGDGNTVFNSGEDLLSGMLKAEFSPAEFHTVTLGYLASRFDYDSGAVGATNYGSEVVDQTASANWRYANPDDRLFDINASAYWTGTDKTDTYLTGVNAGAERSFEIGTGGFDVANTSRFDTGAFAHAVTIGGDFFRDDVTTSDLVGTGDLFTPSGQRTAYGAFLQDQISYSNWLEIVGGLRFDGYDFSGGEAEGDGTRVSPKLAIGVKPFEETFAEGLQLYGSYAEGYRAPAITETLISGIHPGSFSFDFLPNPDLEPEVAHNFEVGVNYARDSLFTEGDRLRLKAAWFHNDVDDYIDAVFAYNPLTRRFQYQYQNVADATLTGVELEATYDMGFMFAGLAASHIRGDNNVSNEPLTTVPADKIVSTLGFRFLEEKLTVGAQWAAVFEQDRVPAGTPGSDSYNLVNLFASYEPRENLVLGVSVENLFDEQYTDYLNDSASEGISVMFSLSARLGG